MADQSTFPTPVGKFLSAGPYRAVVLDAERGGPWAIYGAENYNCWACDGASLLPYAADAERVIRSHGFVPGERGVA